MIVHLLSNFGYYLTQPNMHSSKNCLPKNLPNFEDPVESGHNQLFEIELRGNAQIQLLLLLC